MIEVQCRLGHRLAAGAAAKLDEYQILITQEESRTRRDRARCARTTMYAAATMTGKETASTMQAAKAETPQPEIRP